MKESLLLPGKRLLQRFAANRHRGILFTGEKWFDLEQARNSQNGRIWSVDPLPPELKFVERTQKPKQLMVWAEVFSEAKTPLIFVPNGTKVDRPEYRRMLETEVAPWAEANLGDGWCFQQDGAPSHRAYETQNWIGRNFPNFISVDPHHTNPIGDWAPNSPDWNVMDYFAWPYLQSKACSQPHNSIPDLKASLVREWDAIPQQSKSTSIPIS